MIILIFYRRRSADIRQEILCLNKNELLRKNISFKIPESLSNVASKGRWKVLEKQL